MPSDGAGSQRIVVIGAAKRPPEDAPGASAGRGSDPRGDALAPPTRRPMRATAPRGEARAAMQHSGWTTRRLSVAAVLGAAAVIAGGLVFVSRFGGDRAAGDNPFMAFAFGLFVIGMVVFCAALIALIGTGVSVLAEQRGWGPAAIATFAPLAIVWLVYLVGGVGYAVPAVLSLVLIGGFVVALPRRAA
jgi:hypothetical protein